MQPDRRRLASVRYRGEIISDFDYVVMRSFGCKKKRAFWIKRRADPVRAVPGLKSAHPPWHMRRNEISLVAKSQRGGIPPDSGEIAFLVKHVEQVHSIRTCRIRRRNQPRKTFRAVALEDFRRGLHPGYIYGRIEFKPLLPAEGCHVAPERVMATVASGNADVEKPFIRPLDDVDAHQQTDRNGIRDTEHEKYRTTAEFSRRLRAGADFPHHIGVGIHLFPARPASPCHALEQTVRTEINHDAIRIVVVDPFADDGLEQLAHFRDGKVKGRPFAKRRSALCRSDQIFRMPALQAAQHWRIKRIMRIVGAHIGHKLISV